MAGTSRRNILIAATLATPGLGLAQDARTIRFVVPYPPGGASDVIARLLAGPLGDVLGQTVIVENRPGGNGSVACELVARSAPDGTTLLMGNAGPNALNQALYGRRLSYDVVADFTPIALVSAVPQVLASFPGLPVRDLQSLLQYARERPGEVNYATGGIGSMPHLTLAQLGTMAGVNWVNIAFRGGQASIMAVVAGQVQALMDTAPVVLPQVRDGRVRGIAVTTLTRIPQAPEIPTIAEQGFPGYEATSWGGILGPPKLPAPVLARLNDAVVRAIGTAEVKAAMERQGIRPLATTPAEFAAHIAKEVARWTEVVRAADIRPE